MTIRKQCIIKTKIRKNPYVDNLEWVTPKENTKYHLIEESKKNELYNNRKLTEKDVRFIREQKGKTSTRRIAEIYGVSKTTIINIMNRTFYRNVVQGFGEEETHKILTLAYVGSNPTIPVRLSFFDTPPLKFLLAES